MSSKKKVRLLKVVTEPTLDAYTGYMREAPAEIKRLHEEFQQEGDESFAAQFTDERRLDKYSKVMEILQRAGWKNDGDKYFRGGVCLQSDEGFEVDRTSHMALRDLHSYERLAIEVRGAKAQKLRALRIAFEAGLNLAERVAYDSASEKSGRSKTRDLIRLAIGKAVLKWKAVPGNQSRDPKAPEVWRHYVHPTMTAMTRSSFLKRFSEWKKLPQNQIGEVGR